MIIPTVFLKLLLLLYNDCWHGFWVRSWWPHMLWQAVTLWLVNRGVAVRRGRPVKQVCNRKGTTWYENYAIRFRQWFQSGSRIEPGIRRRLEALGRLWRYCLQGVQALAPPSSRKKIWGKKKSPLRVYVSPSISQTYNSVLPSRIKWERYIFYKEVCFVSLIEVHSLSLIMFLVGSMRNIQHCGKQVPEPILS